MHPSSAGPRDLPWLPGGWDDDGRLFWLSSSRSRLLFSGGEIALAVAVVEVGGLAGTKLSGSETRKREFII